MLKFFYWKCVKVYLYLKKIWKSKKMREKRWDFKKLYIKSKSKKLILKADVKQTLKLRTVVSFHPLQWQPFLLNRKGTRRFFFPLLMNEYFHWGNKKQSMALQIHFCERDLTLGWFQYHFIMFLLESQDVKLFSSMYLIMEALSCKKAILSSLATKAPIKI